MLPALWIGAAVVLLGAVAAFMIPALKKSAAGAQAESVAYAEAA
jgi:hypothetical protein